LKPYEGSTIQITPISTRPFLPRYPRVILKQIKTGMTFSL
jgi:hypothetical protein